MKQIKKVSELSVYHSTIPNWPREERPREKFMKYGPAALSSAELLAIILRTGTGKITAVDLAKTLLKEFRSLDRLAAKSYLDLKKFKGLGDTKAIMISAAFELGKRAAVEQKNERVQINSPQDVVNRFLSEFRGLNQEIFKILLLDSANHLIDEKIITSGILNSSIVHPREVFHHAILELAASIILLHNHPSGNPEPSADDIQITRQMVEAGKVIGIPVNDHIIIARDKYASFAEKGLL
ncbi:MAG: DNA repair protein RadC [Ignavibacteriales bacterium]|nr:DNA repair protein RadC [Ignavibacteriales bacterium]